MSAGAEDDYARLRQQLAQGSWVELDYTGAGFFLTIDVADGAQKLSRSGIIGDLQAEAPDHDPLGLLLFVEDGVARTLEVFGYGDWPDDISQFQLRYVRWIPNPDGNGATAENVDERDLASMWG